MARLELVETSLRQGQQVLLVSRLRQRHAVAVAQQLDGCGFAALDVFGGKTFEAQLRFLGENPFDRLRALREAARSTPLLANLAGQALVGHRHVADDVVDAFINLLADCGIDIIRCFDPLNDIRNLERAIATAKKRKRKVEGVVSASNAPGEMDRLITLAGALADRGCDSICIRDPLGVMSVARSSTLTEKIATLTKLPVTLSFAAQTGQADLAYAAGLASGAQRLDVALSPLAGGASNPAAEAFVAAFRDSVHETGLDLEKVAGASLLLESALVSYGEIADVLAMRLDTSALRGLLPPSAMGHALAELRDRAQLDRLTDVEVEVARIRAELGHPPLVSPMTEIIATQAVYNVCDGDRYATVSQEVKDYCLGLYGAPPTPIDGDIRRVVNGREEPITCRPADLLEPGLEPARAEMSKEGLEVTDAGVVMYALFPAEWATFVRGESVIELLGDEEDPTMPPMPVAVAEPDVVPAVEPVPPAKVEPPQDVRDLTVLVDGQSYEVKVIGAAGSFGAGVAVAASSNGKVAVRPGTVTAPMQGLILKVPVVKGQKVGLGETVAVLEAMKMQNDITATRGGTIAEVYVLEGAVVGPHDPIVHIE